MPEEHVEAFLEAEDKANQLVSALEALRREVGSYRAAHQALDSAAAGMQDASGRLGTLAEATGKTVEVLRTLGTSEILAKLDALSSVADTTLESVRQANAGVQNATGALRGVDEAIRRVATAVEGGKSDVLKALNGVKTDVEGFGKRVTAQFVSQEQSLGRVQSSLSEMKKFAGDVGEKLGNELSTLKAFTIVTLIAILGVAVITLLK